MFDSIMLKSLRKTNGGGYAAMEDGEESNGPQNDISNVRGWPDSAQLLKGRGLTILGEVALLVFPILFIALAVTAWNYDQRPLSPDGKILQRTILLGPTIFPLAFAALSGRSMRNIALWRAERGATIGTLERLHGSQSLVSATWLFLSLGTLNGLSILLLLLWGLSPLGGQSSLRLLREANYTTSEPHSVFYSNEDASSWMLISYSVTYVHFTSGVMLTGISTADTVRNSTMDVWRHPKIPRLLELEQDDRANMMERKWLTIDTQTSFYTSMVGVNILNLQPATEATFIVPYEYMYTDCKVKIRGEENQTIAFFQSKTNITDYNTPSAWGYNGTAEVLSYSKLFNTSVAGDSTIFFDNSFFLVGAKQGPSGNRGNRGIKTVYFASKDFGRNISVYECSFHSLAVEANITCNSAECAVHKLRRSSANRTQESSQGRPWDVVHQAYASRYFFQSFPSIGGLITRFSYHPIDSYIYGNTSVGYLNPDLATWRNWSTVSDNQVSQRLTEVFNTYWDASRWIQSVTIHDPYGLTSINKSSGEPFGEMRMNRTDATLTRTHAVYKANISWVLTLLFCSTSLLILGIINVIISLRTSVPDVFGYVSSLTRGNPHVIIPSGGTTLDGTTRAKHLRDVKVQLGDVQNDKGTGYITLKSFETGTSFASTRVRKGRLYE